MNLLSSIALTLCSREPCFIRLVDTSAAPGYEHVGQRKKQIESQGKRRPVMGQTRRVKAKQPAPSCQDSRLPFPLPTFLL
jgi:hypothetical protein